MIQTTVQYFNGKLSKPYDVNIELYDGRLHIFDTAYTADNGLDIPLSACHYIVLKGRAFIYLNQNSTEYIIIGEDDTNYQSILAGIRQTQNGWYQKLISQKWYVLVSLVIVLLLFIYLLLDKVVPTLAMKFISVKQEIAIGNQFYQSFTEESVIDSASTELLQKFSDQLHLSAQYPIRVTVIKDSIVNAYALPGGHLIVYTGIIRKMDKPQELVALLSHEASHVNKRHSLHSMVSRLTMSIGISLFTADINGLSRSLINNAYMLKVLNYSRSLEKEADEEGMKLMVKNKINPVGMKWLMEELKKQGGDFPSSLSFLSTHPLTAQRIKDADAFAARYKALQDPFDDHLDSIWRALKNKSH